MMSAIQTFMQNLLASGDFSDMEIFCHGRVFKTHQAIVCTQSSYFRSAMCGGFKESIEKAINIQDEDPDTIERVLSYLYLREYSNGLHTGSSRYTSEDSISIDESDSEIEPEPANSTAVNDIAVFLAADKYEIPPLKSLASQKLLNWADTNHASPTFHKVVEVVMTSGPPHEDGLREIMADVISRHILDLIKCEETVRILDMFGSLGSLVITKLVENKLVKRTNENDMFRGLAQKLNNSRRCRHCAKEFNIKFVGGEYLREGFRCAACSTRH
ncbi:BTB/POZ protein [Penicillium herquei]|nr:BTB/POZ protein [Penicillium herquei]